MKKLLTFFIIFLLPFYVFAYPINIIPGGDSIGIKVNTDGLIVVGFYKVNEKYIGKENLKLGDRIIKINNKEVYSLSQLSNIIDSDLKDNKIPVTINRNNKIIDTQLNIIVDNNIYKTGLYVKDSVVGLGTLVYIIPDTKDFGALGHEITMNETQKRVDIRDGNILLSSVNSIDKSRNGRVGSKNASILFDSQIGQIHKNTNKGIYGKYTASLPNRQLMQTATFNEINPGSAYILTVTSKNKIEKYDIEILEKYRNKIDTQKAFSFKIIDKSLINKTGGIVQGMSGSPIIQNNKIIGAVTNVVVDNVTYGYGIYIKTMIDESKK